MNDSLIQLFIFAHDHDDRRYQDQRQSEESLHEDLNQQPSRQFITDRLPVSDWILKKTSKSYVWSLNFIRFPSFWIIRQIAILEKQFKHSQLYGLIKSITPSFLPSSSAYPFILISILTIVQIRKLWKHQKQLLFQLAVSIRPFLSSLRVLHQFQTNEFVPHQDALHESIRWTVYWLIYSAITIIESCQVSSSVPKHQKSPLITRPTIYPSIANSHSRKKNYLRSRLFELFHAWRLQILRLATYSAIKSPSSKPPSRPALSTPTLDIQSSSPYVNEVPIPFINYFFNPQSTRYLLLKFIFLRWCAGECTRGSQKIWSWFLFPLMNSLKTTSIFDSIKDYQILRVIITKEGSSQHPQSRYPDSIKLDQNLPISQASTSSSSQILIPPDFHAETINSSLPVRRANSDPIPSLNTPLNKSVFDYNDLFPENEASESYPLFKPFPITHNPNKKSSFPSDFNKTPENDWNSINLIG
ncbi:hypothetical protein O181_004046 [Austropuccinia psidii MF-1]|uniref:Uncharacterized protein n=1 Tax=Austropuccinia psidii MF-1 TaxID=1389203 RepID=A0A9Q3BG47_9BASI|nr:hypothetical protein [Austropuccinia psidii MF-1]